MSNPFDYVKAVSDTKKDLMRGTENDALAERTTTPFSLIERSHIIQMQYYTQMR